MDLKSRLLALGTEKAKQFDIVSIDLQNRTAYLQWNLYMHVDTIGKGAYDGLINKKSG